MNRANAIREIGGSRQSRRCETGTTGFSTSVTHRDDRERKRTTDTLARSDAAPGS